jgi:hypothetical protein
MYRCCTSAKVSRPDLKNNFFSCTKKFVQNEPLYVTFCIPPSTNFFFSPCSTRLVMLTFCGHVPNSCTYKKTKFLNAYHLRKTHFWAFQTWLYPLGKHKKNLFLTFKRQDLPNGKERARTNRFVCRHTR